MQTPPPSALRAWLFLIRHSFLRQARARLMIWIALGLLALFTFLVAINHAAASPTPSDAVQWWMEASVTAGS